MTKLWPTDDALRLDREIARLLPATWPEMLARFGRLTEVQRVAIPEIFTGRDVIVSAATASGKTEAACAPLVERSLGRREPWMILYVSPTRALVNDLFARLHQPLDRLGLRVERRTGEYRSLGGRRPDVLITTPESFDSMLCRGRQRNPDGHNLATVSAVVLDEIHLLHGTARGEQVRWLLERLRRLRREAAKKGWTKDETVQVVGLSATVPDPDAVVSAFLVDGRTLYVPGGREIEAVAPVSATAMVEDALPAYLAATDEPQKVLVFCNARKRVDELAAGLRPILAQLGYETRAHHGSLVQRVREEAEEAVKAGTRIVVVATATLEIGVDIGDIDLVVLDGPPPDVPSLLQRIGRGNRRTRTTRVMACAGGELESLLQAALIDAARDGWLGSIELGPQHAVALQQVASYIFQSPDTKRKPATLQGLLETCAPPVVSAGLVRAMVEAGELVEDGGGLKLGRRWLDMTARGDIHSNIEGQLGNTVVDEATGQAIALGVRDQRGRGLRTGGQLLEIRKWNEARRIIEVRQTADQDRAAGEWRYSQGANRPGADHPEVLRRYLEIPPDEWPFVDVDGIHYCFHLGGKRRAAALGLAAEAYRPGGPKVAATPWHLRLPAGEASKPAWVSAASRSSLDVLVQARVEKLERSLGRPKQNAVLPMEARVDEVRGWLRLDDEVAALRAARIVPVTDPELAQVLHGIVAALQAKAG